MTAGQVAPGGDADARRQVLQQQREQVGRDQHPQQVVAVPAAGREVGAPVARVDVADRDQERRAGEGPPPRARRAAAGTRGGRRRLAGTGSREALSAAQADRRHDGAARTPGGRLAGCRGARWTGGHPQSGLVWDRPEGAEQARAVWHAWHGGCAWLVVGGAEQQLPGIESAARRRSGAQPRAADSGLRRHLDRGGRARRAGHRGVGRRTSGAAPRRLNDPRRRAAAPAVGPREHGPAAAPDRRGAGPLGHRHAAVDRQRDAGDVRRGGAGEEDADGGELAGRPACRPA
jgi:hypothetical protein